MLYRVQIPFTTHQTHRVEAQSPEEAIQRVAEGEGELECEAVIEPGDALPLDQWQAEPVSDDTSSGAGDALQFWVLIIDDNDYGLMPSVHRSQEHAWHSLDLFVRDYWKQQVGEEPMPADRDERIQVYFDRTQDHAFHIQECVVLGPDLYPLDPTRDVIETQEEHLLWEQ